MWLSPVTGHQRAGLRRWRGDGLVRCLTCGGAGRAWQPHLLALPVPALWRQRPALVSVPTQRHARRYRRATFAGNRRAPDDVDVALIHDHARARARGYNCYVIGIHFPCTRYSPSACPDSCTPWLNSLGLAKPDIAYARLLASTKVSFALPWVHGVVGLPNTCRMGWGHHVYTMPLPGSLQVAPTPLNLYERGCDKPMPWAPAGGRGLVRASFQPAPPAQPEPQPASPRSSLSHVPCPGTVADRRFGGLAWRTLVCGHPTTCATLTHPCRMPPCNRWRRASTSRTGACGGRSVES